MVNATYATMLQRFLHESAYSERDLEKMVGLSHGTLPRQRGGSRPRVRDKVVGLAYAFELTPAQAAAFLSAANQKWTLSEEEETQLQAIRRAYDPIARESLVRVAITQIQGAWNDIKRIRDHFAVTRGEVSKARMLVDQLAEQA